MRAVVVLLLAAVLQVVGPPVASAQTACSELAEVRWQVDAESGRVDGAVVRVPGCEDGSPVGLRVVSGSEEHPAAGPRVAEVVDGEATFDLGELEIAVGPVTGVKVFLALDEADVDCADVDVSLGDHVVASGAGEYLATRSGTHVACHEQAPGTEPPAVLDSALELLPEREPELLVDGGASADGVVENTGDAQQRQGDATGRGALSRTGTDAVTGGLAGLLLVLLGAELIRRVRPRS